MRRLAGLLLGLAGAACVAPAAGPAHAPVAPSQPVRAPGPAPAAVSVPAPVLPAAAAPAPPVPARFVFAGELTQGGWVRGQVPAGTVAASLDDRALSFDPTGQFFAAFDRDAAPTAVLRATLADGRTVESPLAVAPRGWQIEHVNASPTANVPSAEFTARRRPELERIAAARALDSASDGWRQDFVWPATGRISGRFGSQRVYRGEPGSYHSGLDIAAGAGATYVAPADGVVVLATERPFTLEGNLLIVDHGMGLSSAFLHSSALMVREGERVRQGQPLGRVGATGRASGPHLHWGLVWRGARLDPLLFLGPME